MWFVRSCQWAHSAVVARPLCKRKAPGSIPGVSIPFILHGCDHEGGHFALPHIPPYTSSPSPFKKETTRTHHTRRWYTPRHSQSAQMLESSHLFNILSSCSAKCCTERRSPNQSSPLLILLCRVSCQLGKNALLNHVDPSGSQSPQLRVTIGRRSM